MMIKSNKDMLNLRCNIKDMGLADFILGIKTSKTSNELVSNQSHYVEIILEKFNKDDTGVARMPIDISVYLSKNKMRVFLK